MRELTYFSLANRSSNILSQLDKDGNNISLPYINDAKQIITDCLHIESVESVVKHFSSSNRYNAVELTPVIFEIFHNASVSTIINSLKGLKDSLVSLEENEDLQDEKIQELKHFFSSVSDVGLKHLSKIVRSKSLVLSRNASILNRRFSQA